MLFKLVLRYLLSPAGHNRQRVIRIFIGLSLSMAVLLSVISIMDYLQSSRFSTIKEVRSFPVTVETDQAGLDYLKAEYGDEYTLFGYKSGEGLLSSGTSAYATLIRYIGSDYEGGLYTSGALREGGILVPYTQIRNGTISSDVTLTTLEHGRTVRLVPRRREYTVSGFFSTYLGSEFDSQMVFLPLSDAEDSLDYTVAFLSPDGEEEALSGRLASDGYDAVLWSEMETSLYSAMLMEKLVMELLLSSLFIILLVQIVQNASSLASAKRREIAALYLMGFSSRLLDVAAALTGALLAAVSMAFGTLISYLFLKLLPHINHAFSAAHFNIDLGSLLVFALLTVFFSSFFYLRAFRRFMGRRQIMEVVSTV